MAYVKTVVCLANSIKQHPGRCIAGREWLEGDKIGGWIRPVGNRPGDHVMPSEFSCDKRAPRLLDIIEVPLLKPVPHDHQVENHLVDAKPWKRVGELPYERLPELLEAPPSLWINNHANDTEHGFYNCLTPAEAAEQNFSLTLIRPRNCVAIVDSATWEGVTKKKYHARFQHENVEYVLSITDPMVTDVLYKKDVCEYPLENVDLCVSLTEPNLKEKNPRCYKLVAAVFSERPLLR